MEIKHVVEPLILWKPNAAEYSFWRDDWSGLGPLANFVVQGPKPGKMQLKQVYDGETWNFQEVRQVLPNHILEQTKKVPIGGDNKLYRPIWKLSNDDKFSCKTTFYALRQTGISSMSSQRIWHKKLPFKVSFFMMRLLRGRLPTDEVIRRSGIQGPSKCYCCRDAQEDYIAQIFLSSCKAQYVWKYFSQSVGITISSNLKQTLMKWCAAKYEGSYASVQSLLDQVQSLIIMFLKVHYKGIKWQDDWAGICRFLECFKPPMKALKVMWSLPPSGRLKLNTDVSSNVMKRVAGIADIVRDSSGKLVMAYAKALHFCTNNTTETQAALFGIAFNRIHNVILEIDSLLIVNMLNGSSSTFWEIHDDILKMKKIIQSHRIEVQHCYREGNSVADTLSNYGATLDILPIATIFLNVQDLPRETVGVYQMDRRQMPSFRFKRSKVKIIKATNMKINY
ncbi:putative ribonuclease H protein At1g65750 [Nicotiana tomentosiformis]|uniref:putative ribonuclease H protein At1g65750 n=1 Tax=Nicotiana tomentosiformis TaxID=4098 RepID=UPI0008783759|nr:uncharacterized protein LOC108943784 [Nicotiana tomentosiformis]